MNSLDNFEGGVQECLSGSIEMTLCLRLYLFDTTKGFSNGLIALLKSSFGEIPLLRFVMLIYGVL